MAVTENDRWIHIPGMREWHVRAALHALYCAKVTRKFVIQKLWIMWLVIVV